MSSPSLSRDQLASQYLDQLPYPPYAVQEEALLAWFTSDQGVLVSTPTGTGKTLIAEAALYEALHTGRRVYYTTPLIALTEQKLIEFQAAACRWGFSASDVGLVTGNRRVHPDATILVVVAEILFNRLLHGDQFDFDRVLAVVMDEFHSFNDPERGIVWEFSLGLLPPHVKLLLLSATVGNAAEFLYWLRTTHHRRLELVQSDQRRVPLVFQWVGDQLLTEQLERMAQGDEPERFTPTLVFCFNRDQCWDVAEQLKGKNLLAPGHKEQLAQQLAKHDWSQGAGPKLKQILMRGVGVHHAGVLPKYKRIVESLFEQKLLAVTVCTETLAAGINLPARSVVLPGLLKGPPHQKRLIDASSAHQMFGRAGRPQYDTQGYVFALAHEDDVKHLRWKEKYDQIPEDTKDPNLRKAKKALKRKMPVRRSNEQYWTETQFQQLCKASPGRLQSRGALPWRLLAYMLDASPEIEPIRDLVAKRLMPAKKIDAAQRAVDHMLLTLWTAGYVQLEPPPPPPSDGDSETRQTPGRTGFQTVRHGLATGGEPETRVARDGYRPVRAIPTERLPKLLLLRGVHPLYGIFLANHLGIADQAERVQALESLLEMPGSVARFVRVPGPDSLPAGPLATTRLDVELLTLGLATPEQLGAADPATDADSAKPPSRWDEPPPRPLTLAEKLKLLFQYDFPTVDDLKVWPVWAAGELLEYGADFNKYITSKRLQKQEGVLFRHLLRLILLLGEFLYVCPPDSSPDQWREELLALREQIVRSCRAVDPASTDKTLQQEDPADVPMLV